MKKNPAKSNRRRRLKAKTENQREYIRTMVEEDVIICVGPAGSGKTSVSVGMACEYLMDKKIEKIVVTRPIIESGKGLGYLPGNFEEKVHPYLIPVLEEMALYLGRDNLKKLQDQRLIEICPLEYMRGRNFHNSFMILDEAQNATREQIKMFLTRIGWKSKAVINGDPDQCDLPPSTRGSLETCADNLEDVKGVGVVDLDYSDIVRNDIIARILEKI